MRISYYICIWEGNECHNHSKWIKIDTISVICIRVKIKKFILNNYKLTINCYVFHRVGLVIVSILNIELSP